MVLGDPVAVVAEAVGQPGEVDRVLQRLRAGRALGDRRLVEDAEAEQFGHATDASKRQVAGRIECPGFAALFKRGRSGFGWADDVRVHLNVTSARRGCPTPVTPPTHMEVPMSHRRRRRHGRHGIKAVQTAATAPTPAARPRRRPARRRSAATPRTRRATSTTTTRARRPPAGPQRGRPASCRGAHARVDRAAQGRLRRSGRRCRAGRRGAPGALRTIVRRFWPYARRYRRVAAPHRRLHHARRGHRDRGGLALQGPRRRGPRPARRPRARLGRRACSSPSPSPAAPSASATTCCRRG